MSEPITLEEVRRFIPEDASAVFALSPDLFYFILVDEDAIQQSVLQDLVRVLKAQGIGSIAVAAPKDSLKIFELSRDVKTKAKTKRKGNEQCL